MAETSTRGKAAEDVDVDVGIQPLEDLSTLLKGWLGQLIKYKV